ncbi:MULTISPECIES: hypothetical protein [unclassified Streptomyces]|uniref:hypothetical protein n=1 Tax=Streptomyces sp. NPDC006678 TaxID=3157185 RepID=UPI0033C89EB9
MSARTRTPSNAPAAPAAAVGDGVRLRWWALVLPVIAFSALLVLMTGAGQAHAAGDPSPGAFLGWIQLALTGS